MTGGRAIRLAVAVELAREVLAVSRARAFPVDQITMAPHPFDGHEFMLSDPGAWQAKHPLVSADRLKADLEAAIEGLLALVPDVTS